MSKNLSKIFNIFFMLQEWFILVNCEKQIMYYLSFD